MPATKTMDETLAEEWREISAKYATAEEEPAPEAEETREETEAAPEEAAAPDREGASEPETAERPRNADGTFAKVSEAEKEAAKAKPGAVEGESKPEEGTPAPTPERRAVDLTRAPATWKPTVRAEWGKLPEPIRAEILRREQDFQNGQQQLLPDAHFGRSLRQTIEPYRMLIEAEGGTPERAVADLLRTAAIFRVGTPQQKYQAIAQIANQFGLDLRVFSAQQAAGDGNGAQPQAGQGAPLLDPRVDQLIAAQRQGELERAQREQSALEAQVTGWMGALDEKGQPKYPYLEDVIGDMSALLPQIRTERPHLTTAQILEEGYNRAIWAHPEIRTLLQQEAASAHDAQQRADSQSRVREARRAASVNVPRRASLPSPGKPGRIEDTIADKARELGLIT